MGIHVIVPFVQECARAGTESQVRMSVLLSDRARPILAGLVEFSKLFRQNAPKVWYARSPTGNL